MLNTDMCEAWVDYRLARLSQYIRWCQSVGQALEPAFLYGSIIGKTFSFVTYQCLNNCLA